MFINVIISLLLSATFEFDIQNFMPNLPYLISGSEVILLPANSSWADSLLHGIREGSLGILLSGVCFSAVVFLGVPSLYRRYMVREARYCRYLRYYRYLEQNEGAIEYIRSFDTSKPCASPDTLEAAKAFKLGVTQDPSEGISFGYIYGSPNPPPTGDEWTLFICLIIGLFCFIVVSTDYYYTRKKRLKR